MIAGGIRPPQALLFDFNGTISLDEHVLDRLFRDVFAEIGVVFDSAFYYDRLAGRSDPEIVTAALRHFDRADVDGLSARLLRAKIDRYKAAVVEQPTVSADTIL